MTTPQISYNPFGTTNAAGFFTTLSDGLVQGVAMDNPTTRNMLAGGLLATTETLPMWGGAGIFENINGTTPQGTNPLGNTVGRATTLTAAAAGVLIGFSVFNQAHAGVITPQSQVPLFSSGQTVNFFRLGSRAQIALKVAPSLVSLEGGSITQQVSWDFVNQQLVPFAPTYAAVTITGATWANTSGGRTTFTVGTDLTAILAAGDLINVSGVISTGGTGAGFNGSWVVVSVTSTQVVVTQAAASSPGTYSSGGTIAAGGGALPVKIIQIQPTNCKVVVYTASPTTATWNNNGACALVEI